MQVNTNVPIKTLYAVRAALMIAVILIAAGLIFLLVSGMRCEKTDAVVIDSDSIVKMSSTSSTASVHYVTCAYEVNGQKYESRFRTLLPARFREGKVMTVRYEPNDPSRIVNPFILETLILAAGFFGIGLYVVSKAIVIRRRG